MRDIHSHILPGVDDGASSLAESLAMLDYARACGVTSIVCTPHVRGPYTDVAAMRSAFEELSAHAGGFPLQMGFEVNIATLRELGLEQARELHFDGSDELLLELEWGADAAEFAGYERVIYQLQSWGLRVIIAHPERYRAIQRDIGVARDLVRMGCKLQLSCDFIVGGRLGHAKRPAKRLLAEGLVSYIASDAHVPRHYVLLEQACSAYPHVNGGGAR